MRQSDNTRKAESVNVAERSERRVAIPQRARKARPPASVDPRGLFDCSIKQEPPLFGMARSSVAYLMWIIVTWRL